MYIAARSGFGGGRLRMLLSPEKDGLRHRGIRSDACGQGQGLQRRLIVFVSFSSHSAILF